MGKRSSTYRDNVHSAHNHSEDSRREDDPPECESKGFLAHGFGVQIAQDPDSQYHHRPGQGDKASILTHKWPVSVEVALDHGKFRDNKKYLVLSVSIHFAEWYEGKSLTADASGHHVSHSFEEKEAGQQGDLRQHDGISSHDVKKGDDIQDANSVQDDISWTSQGVFHKGHHGGCQGNTVGWCRDVECRYK